MHHKIHIPWRYLAILLTANLALLLPNAHPLRLTGAMLIIAFLPGLSWAKRLLPHAQSLFRWTTAAALSYTFTTLTSLFLHYLPGPIITWQLLIVLNAIALIPLFKAPDHSPKSDTSSSSFNPPTPHKPEPKRGLSWIFLPIKQENYWVGSKQSGILLLLLLIALFLRLGNLPYSEFQGDEALAMISAAEALEGHADALFLRSKGPGEVLLPMALWQLTGTISEPIARLPFTIAAMFAIVTIYLLGQALVNQRVGWIAAGFFAFSGFMVAFGRIVQYQALVVWLSALAFLMVNHWRKTGQYRYALLGGLTLGLGLIAHYDAILVLPALIWLFIPLSLFQKISPTYSYATPSRSFKDSLISGGLFITVFLGTALSFYLPYSLDPQANRTGEYVGNRIGDELRNNLPDFFHFNTFYSSFYYVIITGALVLVALVYLLWSAKWHNRGSRWAICLPLIVALAVVVFAPDLLPTPPLAVVPFALLLLATGLALPFGSPPQALIIWLAVPFLGYNFIVALGLTHIYTIVPAWSLLAAFGWIILFDRSNLPIPNSEFRVPGSGFRVPHPPSPNPPSPIPHPPSPISNTLLILIFGLSIIFLWNSFVRHDIEYWQDYPQGNLSLYWTPYPNPPQAGFFGFAHRTGWKAMGQLIASGQLPGDYGSNEEPDITTWYTRGAPRACDPQPEFYFLADDLIDPIAVPSDVISNTYAEIGAITLPNRKQIRIMQQLPSTITLSDSNEASLAHQFDTSARPDVFARSARGEQSAKANFGNLVQLVGYNLNTQRAYPGGRVPVTLYWQALTNIPTSYQIFTHIESETGLVAQADGVPVCWTYPTNNWRPGQIIADQHAIPLSPDVTPGTYPLEIGLYLPDTFVRLDILDEAGNPAGTSLTLTTLEITEN